MNHLCVLTAPFLFFSGIFRVNKWFYDMNTKIHYNQRIFFIVDQNQKQNIKCKNRVRSMTTELEMNLFPY